MLTYATFFIYKFSTESNTGIVSHALKPMAHDAFFPVGLLAF